MLDEVKELREVVATLTKKVEDLSGLSKQVAEITSGVNLIRDMFLTPGSKTIEEAETKGIIRGSRNRGGEEEAETESTSKVEKEMGSVLESVEEFERLSALLKDVFEECLIGAFMNGLKIEVQAELKMVKVKSLEDVMEKAICMEEKNQLLDEEKIANTGKIPKPNFRPRMLTTQPFPS